MTVHAHPSQPFALPSPPGHPASCLTSVPGSARPALPCPAAPQGFSKERSRETDPPRKFPTGAKLAHECLLGLHALYGGWSRRPPPVEPYYQQGMGWWPPPRLRAQSPRFCPSSSLFSMCIGHPRLLRASSPAAAHFDTPLPFPLSSSPVPAESGY